jgi:hypothetical protein
MMHREVAVQDVEEKETQGDSVKCILKRQTHLDCQIERFRQQVEERHGDENTRCECGQPAEAATVSSGKKTAKSCEEEGDELSNRP